MGGGDRRGGGVGGGVGIVGGGVGDRRIGGVGGGVGEKRVREEVEEDKGELWEDEVEEGEDHRDLST